MAPPNRQGGGGPSPRTLVTASAASLTAAIVTSRIFPPGTVYASALTPVIVAAAGEAEGERYDNDSDADDSLPAARSVDADNDGDEHRDDADGDDSDDDGRRDDGPHADRHLDGAAAVAVLPYGAICPLSQNGGL